MGHTEAVFKALIFMEENWGWVLMILLLGYLDDSDCKHLSIFVQTQTKRLIQAAFPCPPINPII